MSRPLLPGGYTSLVERKQNLSTAVFSPSSWVWLAIPEHGGRASAVARMKVAARMRKVRGALLLLPKPTGVPRARSPATLTAPRLSGTRRRSDARELEFR